MKVFYETLYGFNKSLPEVVFDKNNVFEYSYSLPCYDFETEVKYLAEDYFDNHDGWEDSWPMVFRVWSEEGEHLGDFDVEMETIPEFYVIRITK